MEEEKVEVEWVQRNGGPVVKKVEAEECGMGKRAESVNFFLKRLVAEERLNDCMEVHKVTGELKLKLKEQLSVTL